MGEFPEAREIALKKRNALAPPFHQHIARAKLSGTVCRVGDRVVVYDVVSTDPQGGVVVSENTVVRFC